MSYPYKPDEVKTVQSWTIRFYWKDRIVTCHPHNRNVSYVITDNTTIITALPDYVVKALRKKGFLAMWETEQLRQTLNRLTEVRTKFEEIQKKRTDLESRP